VDLQVVVYGSDDINPRYPDAPYDVIAAAVEGDTQSLRYYEQKETG
jgi:hypothetical protein